MKSSIRIDFAEKNLPVIRVQKVDTDDVRDRLLHSFFEHLGHTSSWVCVKFMVSGPEAQRIDLEPIVPERLPDMIVEAAGRLEENELNAIIAQLTQKREALRQQYRP